jgi:hypothetical protein
MNALVGQIAKVNFALRWRRRDTGADDGSRKDGGDLTRASGSAHVRGRRQFEVLHDGSKESKPSG